MYNIKTLCEKANISQQTFYRLMREHEDFRDLVEKNKEKKGNGFRYSEAVLDWIRDYRGLEPEQQPTAAEAEKPSEAPEKPSEPILNSEREKELLSRIAALEAQINRLTADLDNKEQERKALFMQNANLLMLLTQEKAEKQALLPAPKPPKQSLGQRLKSMFGNKSNQEQPDS